MPIYEYEPVDRDCLMCQGRVEALQGVHDEPLKDCPQCGLQVRRVISRASFSLSTQVSPEAAAQKGFTTYKRAGKGVYEKVAGEGADQLGDGS